MVFVSGQGGAAPDGTLPADFEEQARNTFENLKRCLEMAGAGLRDIVKVNYYVADIANLAALRRVRSEFLDMENPPASTLVECGLVATGKVICAPPNITSGSVFFSSSSPAIGREPNLH
jgi:enamine deaminase RidA (YjgF/YER057c/UK114 family)